MKKPFDYNLAHDTRFKMWTMFLSEPLKATCQVCTKKIGIAEPFYFVRIMKSFTARLSATLSVIRKSMIVSSVIFILVLSRWRSENDDKGCCSCIHPSTDYFWIGVVIGMCALYIAWNAESIWSKARERDKR